MAEKRRGLGRGLGALIPSAPSGDSRPVDVFFPGGVAAREAVVQPEEREDRGGVVDERSARASLTDERAAPTNGPAADGSWSTGRDRTGVSDRPDGQDREPPAGEVTRHALRDGSQTGVDTDPDQRSTGPAEHTNGWTRDLRAEHAPALLGDAAASTSLGRAEEDDTDLLPVPGVHFAELPVDSVQANPRQPRTVFDEDALTELVASIREIGVLQPVVVRPLEGRGDDGEVRYELIMGERRLRATRAAGLATIPAIVRETDDGDLLRDALLENLHRSDLNALEEAAAYQQLLDDFGCTHDELARRIHRSRPQISNTLRLLRLPPSVQRRVAAGVLSAGHARALLGLQDGAAMERLAQRVVAEGLSVRATEEVVTLGGDPEARTVARRPRPGDRNAALDDLAARLSDRFETRVKVALGKSKGRLTVEFASVQDLNRILATLSPDDPGLLR